MVATRAAGKERARQCAATPAGPRRARSVRRPTWFSPVETTGLDPQQHELLEIGLVWVTANLATEIGSWRTLIIPERLDIAEPRALEVCAFDAARWAEAGVALDVALAGLTPWLKGAYLAGHHVAFDAEFVDSANKRTGMERPAIDHRMLDAVSLSWPVQMRGEVESLSLHADADAAQLARGAAPAAPRPRPCAHGARCRARVVAEVRLTAGRARHARSSQTARRASNRASARGRPDSSDSACRDACG
ncbi:MAG: 3'-5' exonuclease [Sandaracinaceae bacterium]|nr:3'-5' exonuclease [Myxococcales bacterium]MCB9656483.1 3'-5' exonuclease [Sandaracinaceae bacterium]